MKQKWSLFSRSFLSSDLHAKYEEKFTRVAFYKGLYCNTSFNQQQFT